MYVRDLHYLCFRCWHVAESAWWLVKKEMMTSHLWQSKKYCQLNFFKIHATNSIQRSTFPDGICTIPVILFRTVSSAHLNGNIIIITSGTRSCHFDNFWCSQLLTSYPMMNILSNWVGPDQTRFYINMTTFTSVRQSLCSSFLFAN